MTRLLFGMICYALSLSVLWYAYAPTPYRTYVPDPIADSINWIDEALTEGVSQFVDWTTSSQTPTAPHLERPLVIGQNDGILTVYESFDRSDLFTGTIDPTMFIGATLDGANFSHAELSGVMLDGMKAPEALFADARIAGATARGTVLSRSVFHRTDMTGAQMERARLEGAIVTASRLRRADFTAARLAGALFRGGDASGAQFNQADLTNTVFDEINIARASFTGSDVSGADFTASQGLTQAQLDDACGDTATRLPVGLRVSPCHQGDALTLTVATAMPDHRPTGPR